MADILILISPPCFISPPCLISPPYLILPPCFDITPLFALPNVECLYPDRKLLLISPPSQAGNNDHNWLNANEGSRRTKGPILLKLISFVAQTDSFQQFCSALNYPRILLLLIRIILPLTKDAVIFSFLFSEFKKYKIA